MSKRFLRLALAVALPFAALSATAAINIADDRGIPYASGGVGLGEREQLENLTPDYSLKLVFAEQGSGSFVSRVAVTISAGGQIVMQVLEVGPWLLAKLPAGEYRVVAESRGRTLEETIKVRESGLTEAVLRFPPEAPAEPAPIQPMETMPPQPLPPARPMQTEPQPLDPQRTLPPAEYLPPEPPQAEPLKMEPIDPVEPMPMPEPTPTPLQAPADMPAN